MRRTVLTAALLSGLVVGGASPAAAAPPEREKRSGDFTSLFSSTNGCTPEAGGGQTCTDIFLSARTDTAGRGSVSLDIQTYSISEDGDFTPISSESGFSEEEVDLTVTGDFDATLAPTPMTLQAFTCTPEDCEEAGRRDVVVSAFDRAVGPAVKRQERGSFRDGTCTFRFSSTSTAAPVEGTITLDGVTYDEVGSAEVGEYRVTQSCRQAR